MDARSLALLALISLALAACASAGAGASRSLSERERAELLATREEVWRAWFAGNEQSRRPGPRSSWRPCSQPGSVTRFTGERVIRSK